MGSPQFCTGVYFVPDIILYNNQDEKAIGFDRKV
jgi:hypothetical protein